MSAEDKRDIEITRKDLYCQRPEISMDWKYKLQFLITFKKKENVWNTRQFIRLLLCYYLLIWYNCKIRPPTLLFSSVDNNVPPCKVVSSNIIIWKPDPFILLLCLCFFFFFSFSHLSFFPFFVCTIFTVNLPTNRSHYKPHSDQAVVVCLTQLIRIIIRYIKSETL